MMHPNDIIQRGKEICKEYRQNGITNQSREEFAEIHTPQSLVNDMLDQFPDESWTNKSETWLDPAAGTGVFPLLVAERLMQGLKNVIEDPFERYQHIMENQIFMIELQIKNGIEIERILNPNHDLNLNLKCCDALKLEVRGMEPKDWKTRRFNQNYNYSHAFWGGGVEPYEEERLEEFYEICKNQDVNDEIIARFEQGYESLIEA